MLGYDTNVGSSASAIVEEIEPGQLPILMVIGAGFVAVQLVFALLYLRAHVLRDVLGLDAYERSKTREEIQGFLLATGVGLISRALAVLGGETVVSWAGYVYLLLFPVLRINSYLMDSQPARLLERLVVGDAEFEPATPYCKLGQSFPGKYCPVGKSA